jgi:hypothetical protein
MQFTTTGDLHIKPAKTSSSADFDFYIGKWKIHNRKLKSRLNNCTEWIEFEAVDDCYHILNGFGNINQYSTAFDDKPFEGMTLRLFNPQTKLWSIYWADSNVVVLLTAIPVPFSQRIFLKGKKLLYNFIGIKPILIFPCGARLFRQTMEKHGNGIGI